jgi:hypothetical protein
LSCTSLSQPDRRTFGRRLHPIHFVHHQDAHIVAA